jgi:hypothetical protein
MNWKRGFRRITFVLSMVGAIIGAVCAVTWVQSIHRLNATSLCLIQYEEPEEPPDLTMLIKARPFTDVNAARFEMTEFLKALSKRTEWEEWRRTRPVYKTVRASGFWGTLPTWGLIGLCGLGGLGGAAIGFCTTWFWYLILESLVPCLSRNLKRLVCWVVRGFQDSVTGQKAGAKK